MLDSPDMMLQGTFVGRLNHRTIGHRVRKWHTKLDNIGTRFNHFIHQTNSKPGISARSGLGSWARTWIERVTGLTRLSMLLISPSKPRLP